ncbi:MAG: pyridoxamine 5'-phosphate oxidase family protein [Chloroflexota bacterium]|nr:pyridoxamine 5'-phosphate oxidase family protein [Chloroflexota bacterium]
MVNMRNLLDGPTAAVLAVYRSDGTVLMSPVWFRAAEEWVEIVIAEGDRKLERLRADPRAVFMAFETSSPFAGFRVEAVAELSTEGVREARLEIATRYLGVEGGHRYVDQRTKPGVLVRLALGGARTWDLRAILPG